MAHQFGTQQQQQDQQQKPHKEIFNTKHMLMLILWLTSFLIISIHYHLLLAKYNKVSLKIVFSCLIYYVSVFFKCAHYVSKTQFFLNSKFQETFKRVVVFLNRLIKVDEQTYPNLIRKLLKFCY